MNSKWYWSIIIIALAFLGISFEQKQLPNQEIEVHFNDAFISEADTEKALASIKNHLGSIGITDFQVNNYGNKLLKISYYSALDVSLIKVLFSKQEQFLLDFNTNKENPLSNSNAKNLTYQLNVSEIPSHSKKDLGLNGILVDIKYAREHYVNNLSYFNFSETDISFKIPTEEIKLLLFASQEISEKRYSYKIPEVRAGPFS